MKVLLRVISVIVVILFAGCEAPTRPVATAPEPSAPPAAPPEVFLPNLQKEQLLGMLRATVMQTRGVLEQSSEHHIVFAEPTTSPELQKSVGEGARLRYRFTVFEQDEGCRLTCEAWVVEAYGTPKEQAHDVDYGGKMGRALQQQLNQFRDKLIHLQSKKKEL